MPANTDLSARRRKKKEALQSTVTATLIHVAVAVLMLYLGSKNHSGTTLGWVLVILAIINLVTIFPTWKVYHSRIKEIDGGEEDAAAQY